MMRFSELVLLEARQEVGGGAFSYNEGASRWLKSLSPDSQTWCAHLRWMHYRLGHARPCDENK